MAAVFIVSAFSDLSGTVADAQLPAVPGVAGSYTNASVTVDSHGRITAAASGAGGGGGGGTPGGASGSVQWNNAGVLAGFGTWDGSHLGLGTATPLAQLQLGAGGWINLDASPDTTAGICFGSASSPSGSGTTTYGFRLYADRTGGQDSIRLSGIDGGVEHVILETNRSVGLIGLGGPMAGGSFVSIPTNPAGTTLKLGDNISQSYPVMALWGYSSDGIDGGGGLSIGGGGVEVRLFRTADNNHTISTAGAGPGHLFLKPKASLVIGDGALPTTATNGFLHLPGGAGPPTGTPTAFAGRYPLYFDSTNNKLYIYNSGWKSVTLT